MTATWRQATGRGLAVRAPGNDTGRGAHARRAMVTAAAFAQGVDLPGEVGWLTLEGQPCFDDAEADGFVETISFPGA